MTMRVAVFVNRIDATGNSPVIEASNGSVNGPPFVRFTVSPNAAKKINIGDCYHITIERDDPTKD